MYQNFPNFLLKKQYKLLLVYKTWEAGQVRWQLSFRDSSHILSASSFRVYHLLQPKAQHLSFRNSSHTLSANKPRAYHLSKKLGTMHVPVETVFIFSIRNSHSFIVQLWFFLSFVYCQPHQNFQQKVSILAYPLQKIGIVYTYLIQTNSVECNHMFVLFIKMVLQYGDGSSTPV